MNRRKKIIESYCLLFVDLITITISFMLALLLRYRKFSRVMEPELHFMGFVCFLLFCTMYSFLLDWNRDFLTRGVFVELIAVLKYNLFMALAFSMVLFVTQKGIDFSRLVWGYFTVFDMILGWLVRLLEIGRAHV